MINELPENWERAKLQDIAEINPKFDRLKYSDELDVSFVPMKSVSKIRGIVNLSEVKKFGEVKRGYTPFRDGDVIFAKITPCMENGKIAILNGLTNGIGFGSTEFHVFRLPKYIPRGYLFYYLVQDRFRNDAERNMTGSVGHKRVPTIFLQEKNIPIPPLLEQQRIVAKIEELFTRLDAGVDALQQVQIQLKRYRQSVLKAAVEGRLTAEWRKQHKNELEPADKLLERILEDRREKWEAEQLANYKAKGKKPSKNWQSKYKEPTPPVTSSLPKLPEGWVWSNFDLLVKFSQNGFGKRKSKEGKDTIVLRLADIENGKISYKSVRRIAATKDEIQKYQLEINDLICTRVNGSPDLVGRMTLFKECDDPILFCDHFIRFRLLKPNYVKFLRYYFDSRTVREYVNLNKVSSAGQNTVSQGTIKNIPIPIPCKTEETHVVSLMEHFFSISDDVQNSIEIQMLRIKSLGQSILKQAFEGKLVPQDPSDESASVLLERIKAEKAKAKKI